MNWDTRSLDYVSYDVIPFRVLRVLASPYPLTLQVGFSGSIVRLHGIKVWREQFIEGFRRLYTVNKSLHCSMALARILETGCLAVLLEPSGPCCKRGFGQGFPFADLNPTRTRVADIQCKVSTRLIDKASDPFPRSFYQHVFLKLCCRKQAPKP